VKTKSIEADAPAAIPAQSVEPQRLELREYCARRGWSEVTEYVDKISGAKFTRLGLDTLMADVRKHRVGAVVCVKLDRLGRSLTHLAQIIGELDSHKCALICVSQNIDTREDNPCGRLQMGVLIAVSQFERSLIQERTRSGLAVARAMGKRLGRVPFEMTPVRQTALAAWAAVNPRPPLSALAKGLGCSIGKAHALAKSMTTSSLSPIV
jgi:DNA invertase Pin-like site-specific DNA recombinase